MQSDLGAYLDSTRLLYPDRSPADAAKRIYDLYASPILGGLGLAPELVEIYSLQKKSELVTIDDRHYLVFDHALSEALNQLNSLARLREVDSFIAAAMQRMLAEAMRSAEEPGLYAFFVRRALEVKPVIRVSTLGETHGLYIFWQDLFILYHEAAHALADQHPLREQLFSNALMTASSMMDETIGALNGKLIGMIDEQPQALQQSVEEWLLTRDDLALGEDAIQDAVCSVATDQRFLDELVCDAFAVTCVLDNIGQRKHHYESAQGHDIALEALTACYRTFLNMRMLQYVDDICRTWREQIEVPKINPLNLRLLVEMGFRSNAFVRAILGQAAASAGVGTPDALPHALSAIQESHTGLLMRILNALLEKTVLNPEFHAGLDAMLGEDGFEPGFFAGDTMRGFEIADGFWKILAAWR